MLPHLLVFNPLLCSVVNLYLLNMGDDRTEIE